jgi:hypothetical protein
LFSCAPRQKKQKQNRKQHKASALLCRYRFGGGGGAILHACNLRQQILFDFARLFELRGRLGALVGGLRLDAAKT